jgi:hypothetical protein
LANATVWLAFIWSCPTAEYGEATLVTSGRVASLASSALTCARTAGVVSVAPFALATTTCSVSPD